MCRGFGYLHSTNFYGIILSLLINLGFPVLVYEELRINFNDGTYVLFYVLCSYAYFSFYICIMIT